MTRPFSCHGFTLPEIIVALTILGIVAMALLPVFNASTVKSQQWKNKNIAILTAHSLLAEIGYSRPLQRGDFQGVVQTGGRWKISMMPFEDKANSGIQPYIVNISVETGTGRDIAHTSLSSIRLKQKETP